MLLAFAVLLAGCDLMAVKQQQTKAGEYCELQGTIRTEHSGSGHLVVVLLQQRGGPVSRKENWALADHFVLEQLGWWFFFVPAGKYLLSAFEDINRNQSVEPNEPALPPDFRRVVDCAAGTTHSGLALVIPETGRIAGDTAGNIADLQVRSVGDQLGVTLGQRLTLGHVTTIDDPRFDREIARKGLWRPFDFIMEGYAGVYFLQPYDPDKIPVLFVHGINGTPLDFAPIIARLDQSQFQPWLFYYPSGAQLARVGKVLAELLVRLRAERGFRQLPVVAHSMGGLVSRHALLFGAETGDVTPVPLFITIASPWNGHAAAQIGVDHAPMAVYSWIDIAPGSRFLSGLFYEGQPPKRRSLPPQCAHHLIFTFLPTESGDGTISLESQLRIEAQQEAARLYGFSQSHDGVLSDPSTIAVINRILAAAADSREGAGLARLSAPFSPEY